MTLRTWESIAQCSAPLSSSRIFFICRLKRKRIACAAVSRQRAWPQAAHAPRTPAACFDTLARTSPRRRTASISPAALHSLMTLPLCGAPCPPAAPTSPKACRLQRCRQAFSLELTRIPAQIPRRRVPFLLRVTAMRRRARTHLFSKPPATKGKVHITNL